MSLKEQKQFKRNECSSTNIRSNQASKLSLTDRKLLDPRNTASLYERKLLDLKNESEAIKLGSMMGKKINFKGITHATDTMQQLHRHGMMR